MDNGYWFVVNGEEKYFPASLMKVHTMVLLLKKEMMHPGFLDQKVFFDPKLNVPSRNEYHLEPGRTYTVRQLMEYMVKNSDNMSTTLLHDYASLREMGDFYNEIGLSFPKMQVSEAHQLDDFMQISEYTKIIRMLYNASYLTKDFSEYALSLLGDTHFNLGLTAGLPQGFTASHKYGVWKNNGKTELHDCGIIYHQGKAYLLAVMSQGKDEYELADVIKGISKLVTNRVQNKIVSKAG